MTKNDISSEELEQMNYNDIAYLILQKKGKMVKITDLFKEVCELLDLNEEEYQSHIADFFELLSTDKRFVMLDNNEWDIRDNHSVTIVMDDEDEEEIDEIEEEDEDLEEEIEEDELENIDDDLDDDLDDEDEDLSELSIVEDEEDEDLEQ